MFVVMYGQCQLQVVVHLDRKVEETFQRHQRERSKLKDEYQKQMMSVLTQMENDIDKTKDAEEKVEVYIGLYVDLMMDCIGGMHLL